MIRFLLSLSARFMAHQSIRTERDRVKAKARQLRDELGLPPHRGLL